MLTYWRVRSACCAPASRNLPSLATLSNRPEAHRPANPLLAARIRRLRRRAPLVNRVVHRIHRTHARIADQLAVAAIDHEGLRDPVLGRDAHHVQRGTAPVFLDRRSE